MWFGDEFTTNNETELRALELGLEWVVKSKLPSGEWLVLGDSNLILGYCTKRFRPQQKFLPGVQRVR
jgi:ribonuclease HI